MKVAPPDHRATIMLRHGDGTQSLYVSPSAHNVQRRHVCKQLYWTTQLHSRWGMAIQNHSTPSRRLTMFCGK